MERATFEAILQGHAKLELNQPLDWQLVGTRVRAKHRLKSALSVPVTLVAAVGTFETHRPTFLIHDGAPGKNNACRLDVRGSHANLRTDRRRWTNQTHLHVWRDDCQEWHAVDPIAPWPPSWFQDADNQITSEQLREIFEMFCQMFSVTLGSEYQWVDPLTLVPQPPTATTGNGDVIP